MEVIVWCYGGGLVIAWWSVMVNCGCGGYVVMCQALLFD